MTAISDKSRPCHIYIDVSNLMSQGPLMGIQRMVRGSCKYIIQNQVKGGYNVHLLRWDAKKKAFRMIDNDGYLFWLNCSDIIMEEYCSGQVLLPEQIRKDSIFLDLDTIWFNEPRRHYLYTVLKHRGVKIAVMIYDIIPITHPQYSDKKFSLYFLQYLDACLAYADIIFTASNFTENEIKKLFLNTKHRLPKFVSISINSDLMVYKKNNSKINMKIKKAAESAPYLFTVGPIEPRKNHDIILKAFDNFLEKTGVNIIFIDFKKQNKKNILKRIYKHPLYNERIFCFEKVNDETISYLYQQAKYAVFSSYAEGNGLLAIEALIFRVPVLLSDIPVMHEAAGEYAQYFDPDNPKELANLVMEGLSNSKTYQKRKQLLLSYCPTTWNDFGESVMKGLKTLVTSQE